MKLSEPRKGGSLVLSIGLWFSCLVQVWVWFYIGKFAVLDKFAWWSIPFVVTALSAVIANAAFATETWPREK